jgi:hypothetical protein
MLWNVRHHRLDHQVLLVMLIGVRNISHRGAYFPSANLPTKPSDHLKEVLESHDPQKLT